MQIGIVGLGRMGANIARRLIQAGHQCVVYNRSPEPVAALVREGAAGAGSLAELVAALQPPRAVWVMVPAGEPTEDTVQALTERVAPNDVIIDGGNSYFKDSARRARTLSERGVHYLDIGTSGGVWGLERGYCLMVGGPEQAFRQLEPVLAALAPGAAAAERTPGRSGGRSPAERGYLHCGPNGAGHYVKMIHNGIEYGLMQAYAEGFDMLKTAAAAQGYRFDLDAIAELWRRGSVVGSWLLDLTATALAEDPTLERYSGHVTDSGEGRWAVQTAIEQAVPADVLAGALFARFRSRQQHTFAEQVLSAMREQFGGHREPTP